MGATRDGMLERTYKRGSVLFSEGEETSELYVLLSGAVEVTKKGRHIAPISTSGSYFGEMSSMLGVARTATVTATEDTTILVVPADRLRELFAKTPQLALRMTKTLMQRLAKTTADLVENCVWETGESAPES